MDAHEARWREALKRLGVDTVRARLSYGVADPKPEWLVANIVDEPPDPPRKFIEDWLAEKEATAAKNNSRIAKLTLIASLIAAATGVAAVIEGWPRH